MTKKSLSATAAAVFSGLMIFTGAAVTAPPDTAHANENAARRIMPQTAIDIARDATVAIMRNNGAALPQQALARGLTPAPKEEFTPDYRGTGFHIGNGYIVTAYHVAEERDSRNAEKLIIPQEIRIMSRNLDELPAQLVGASRYTDIAVYRIDPAKAAKYLGVTPLAGRDMVPGEAVFTIGYPLGWGPAQAFGHAGETSVFLSTTESRVAQLDLSACSGNSGGGVFNADGKIVGMAHAVIGGDPKPGETGTCSNIFFAIPGDVMKTMVESLIAGKELKFSRIGAGLTVSRLGDSWRVAASSVSGPAAKAGMQPGDIFLSIAGTAITDAKQLKNYLIEKTHPGDTVAVEIMRGNQKKTLSITLEGS